MWDSLHRGSADLVFLLILLNLGNGVFEREPGKLPESLSLELSLSGEHGFQEAHAGGTDLQKLAGLGRGAGRHTAGAHAHGPGARGEGGAASELHRDDHCALEGSDVCGWTVAKESIAVCALSFHLKPRPA